MLTPVQYAILMDGKNVSSIDQPNKGKQDERQNRDMKEGRDAKGHDFREGGGFNSKGYQDPKEQALGSVIIKMLNDRSIEQTQPKV